MTANDESVQLSDYCFDVFEAVNAAIQEENTDNPSESAEIALGDLERCVNEPSACPNADLNDDFRVIGEIERTLRVGASTPRINYDKSKIEKNKLEIRQILDALSIQSSSINRGDSMDELASFGSRITTTTRAAATVIGTGTGTTASVSKDGRS